MKFRIVNADYDYPDLYVKKLTENGFVLEENTDDGFLKIYIFINTAEQFKLLSNLCNQDLVLTFATEKTPKLENRIIIYDGWLE